MSISDHGPVEPSHTPLADDERVLFDSDDELSRMLFQALEDKDFDLVVLLMEEKVSIENALEPSRWDTFNRRMEREFFGGDHA